MNKPLMPKATAVWLIQNTKLTFKQIAEFCHLHPLEVQAIADGDARTMVGYDPLQNHQLTIEEIERCEKDPMERLTLKESVLSMLPKAKKTNKAYTPLAYRQERPDGILWLIVNYPSLSDSVICKLLSTTKPTVQSIRKKTHKNFRSLKPQNPVLLGLCTQKQFDEALMAVKKHEEA